MKHKIEKNTVQETLILPLYSRKLCTELYPNLYQDETAVRLIDEIDYDFSEAEKNSRSLMQRFGALEDAFPGGVLVFDAANRTAVKMIAKTWLRTAKIKDVGAYFAVSDAKSELSPWDSRLQVSSRGYMLGYNDLKDPSVSGFFRFLARVGDNGMKMQIVKIGFGDRQ